MSSFGKTSGRKKVRDERIFLKCGIEEEVIEGVAGRCAEVAADLREAKKKG